MSDQFSVLIADDNLNNLFTLETLISAHMEARILRAHDGEEVLATLLKEKVDLIILDVHMPRMDGFECARLIRMRPGDRDIPILFLTASMRSDEARSQGLDLGAVDYLRKPIDDRVLINKINGFRQLVVRERQEQQSLEQTVQKTSRKLAKAEELTAEVVGSMTRGLAVIDAVQLVMTNPAFDALIKQVAPQAPLESSGDYLRHLECTEYEVSEVVEGRGFEPRERPWRATQIGELMTWLSVRATAINDGRVMVVVEDITERKIFEQTLRDALERAEAASRAKTEFLGNMSHEVRTPLNGVLGIAQLLRKGEVLPAQERYLRLLEDSSLRLLGVVNDILDFSRMEAGQVQLTAAPLDLWRLVGDLVALHTPLAEQTSVELSLFADPAPERLVVGDEQRLSQVLVNLISNALKFTEAGRVQLGLRVLEQVDDALTVRLSVSDTGIGMSEEHLERLFERFEQGDASRTKRYGGTGLGLSICKGLVEAMGGAIDVESKLGAGSTFSVTLRFELSETLPAAAGAQDASDLDWGGTRVLVAEDDPVNQLVVQTMLENLGVYVEIAAHGEEAVDKSEVGTFDLILMDLHMPHMDGLEATERIRARQDPTPIIALTANILPETMHECLELGMDGYLSKPMRMEDLEMHLATTLRREPEPKRASPAKVRVSAAPEEAAHTVLDEAFLSQQRELLGAAFEPMIHAYFRGMEQNMTSMRSALAAGERHELRGHAHKAKSSSLQVGAEWLVASCQRLESACLEDEPLASLGMRIDELERRYQATERLLKHAHR